VPRTQHGAPCLETLGYVAAAGQLFERHEALGLSNPLRVDRRQLQALGVPVPEPKRKCRRRQSGQARALSERRHMAFANKGVARWVSQNPGASDAEREIVRLRRFDRWSDMSKNQREEWALRHLKIPTSQHSLDASEPEPVAPIFMNELHTGDEKWPLSLDHFTRFLDGGCTQMMKTKRWEARTMLVVSDGESAIPRSKQFTKRFSCGQRHPGLCWHRDAEIYDVVLEIARYAERWATNDKLHHCLRLVALRRVEAKFISVCTHAVKVSSAVNRHRCYGEPLLR
jgi:hypothetical protein